MNDIVKKEGNLPAAIGDLANKMVANVAAHASTISTGDAYGGFAKDGLWFFGQERIEPQEGSQWAINPFELRHGWIFWPEAGGKPTEITVKITEPFPSESDLPQTNEEGRWAEDYAFQALCLNGEDEGQQVIFKGSSLGFKKAFVHMAGQIAGRAQEGLSDVVPVVELGAGSYNHSKYGKIYTPEMKVVGWKTLDGLAEVEAEDAPDEAEQAPEQAPEPEPAAPKRRRRVRA